MTVFVYVIHLVVCLHCERVILKIRASFLKWPDLYSRQGTKDTFKSKCVSDYLQYILFDTDHLNPNIEFVKTRNFLEPLPICKLCILLWKNDSVFVELVTHTSL